MEQGRRDFFKKAALGAVMVAGAGGCGTDGGGGGDGSLPSRTDAPGDANLLRLSMARTDLPIGLWDELLALHTLTRQIMADPGVAEHFARDPQGYLASIRLDHVQLDLESIEVKVAVAVGDPALRKLIEDGDYRGLIDSLAARGLMGGSTSTLNRRAIAMISTSLGIAEGAAGTEPDAVYPVLVLFVIIAVTYVTVGYTIVAAVQAATRVAYVVTYLAPQEQRVSSASILRHAPGLAVAGIVGGSAAEEEAAASWVESTAEYVAQLMESSEVYRQKSTLTPAELRDLAKRTLRQQLALTPA